MRRATRTFWLPLMMLSVGCASTRCGGGGCDAGGCPTGALVPFRDACQEKKCSDNCLGRLWGWATYRPLCSKTPCGCGGMEGCTPPLFSFFTCSKYCCKYEPIDCDGNKICDKPACKPCDEPKGPLTICITLPRISFGRGGAPACPPEPVCKPEKCDTCPPAQPCRTLKLPCPIADPGRPRLLSGCGPVRGALGICGPCGRCGDFGKTCCTHSPPAKVDIHNLPIVPPTAMKSCSPGAAPVAPPPEAAPLAEPLAAPKTTEPAADKTTETPKP